MKANKTKILITEDESVVALHLEQSLIALGYKVTGTARSKSEVLACLNEEVPDLILMDIVIQGKEDGIQVAEHVKTLYDIPVIFLTAHSDIDTVHRAKMSGPFGYIIKPFEERELASVIEITMYKYSMEVELSQSRKALKKANEHLEVRVKDRTKELRKSNIQLKKEMAQKELVEKALIASENRYKGLFSNAMDAIIAIDSKGMIQLFNPAAGKMFGYTTKEIVGKNVKRLMPKSNSLKHDGYINQHGKRDTEITGSGRDVVAMRKDGALFDAELRVHEANIDEGVRFLGFIRDISQRVEVERQLQVERRNRLTVLIAGQEMERSRLARELHDGLGQLLMGVKLSISHLNKQKAKGKSTDRVYKDAMDLVDTTMLEVRNMSHNLVPSILKDFGLPAALKKMGALLKAGSDVNFRFNCRGFNDRLSPILETGMYRVAQEATANALNHGKASEIKVRLVNGKKALLLTIFNNGNHFDVKKATKAGGSGLLNMQQRAIVMGGELSIISAKGEGTRVRLTINK